MSWEGPSFYPFMDGCGLPPLVLQPLPPPEPLPPLDHVDRYITGLGAAPPRIPDRLWNPVEDPKPFVTFTMLEPPPLDMTVFKPERVYPEPEPMYIPSWERPVKPPYSFEEPMFVFGEVIKKRDY